MNSNYEEAIALTDQLSVPEKIRLLEHLASALKRDFEREAYRHMPWEQFINLTYGSLADDPIEREQPMQPDERDLLE
ncbi:hypothetical protein HC928_07280 [bacterium]|nr:hypothetical protein [bacterium]